MILCRWIAALPPQRAHPAAQHGIGEQPLALQLEEHRAVADVGDPIADRTPRSCRLAREREGLFVDTTSMIAQTMAKRRRPCATGVALACSTDAIHRPQSH